MLHQHLLSFLLIGVFSYFTPNNLDNSISHKRNPQQNTFIHNYVKEYNKLAKFNELELSGSFKVKIEQGSSYKVQVMGEQSLVEKINVSSSKQILKITTERNSNNQSETEVIITLPELKEIELNGALQASMNNFAATNIDIEVNGASTLNASVQAKEMEVEISGASSITISGKTELLTAEISGASVMKGFDLEAQKVNAEVSGAGKLQITAIREISIEGSGASKVIYRGNPTTVNKELSGAAKCEQQAN